MESVGTRSAKILRLARRKHAIVPNWRDHPPRKLNFDEETSSTGVHESAADAQFIDSDNELKREAVVVIEKMSLNKDI